MRDHFDYCQNLVKQNDQARYLSTLLASKEKQQALFSLYAFEHEVSSIRQKVSEPLAGEIRLQWWKDTIDGFYKGESTGNPVARALSETILAYNLPQQTFQNFLKAKIFDLYDDPAESVNSLEGYYGETYGAVYQLACLIVQPELASKSGTISGHAGVAKGMANSVLDLPKNIRTGQLYLPVEILGEHGFEYSGLLKKAPPKEHLRPVLKELIEYSKQNISNARSVLADCSKHLIPIFADLSVIEPKLKKLMKLDYDYAHDVVTLSPLHVYWLVFLTAFKGKL